MGHFFSHTRICEYFCSARCCVALSSVVLQAWVHEKYFLGPEIVSQPAVRCTYNIRRPYPAQPASAGYLGVQDVKSFRTLSESLEPRAQHTDKSEYLLRDRASWDSFYSVASVVQYSLQIFSATDFNVRDANTNYTSVSSLLNFTDSSPQFAYQNYTFTSSNGNLQTLVVRTPSSFVCSNPSPLVPAGAFLCCGGRKSVLNISELSHSLLSRSLEYIKRRRLGTLECQQCGVEVLCWET